MSGLFGGKTREERDLEKQQAQIHQQQAAGPYDGLVTKSLEQLARWAFPDSQVERSGPAEWKLWHPADNGEKYVDVTVTLAFHGDRPECFECETELNSETTDDLTREALNDALRWTVCQRM